jgi:transcription elongation GreA/GreB family factor
MSWNEKLQELVANLEQERDELRLKVHLASRDARDEFEALEARLDALRARLAEKGTEAQGTAAEVGDVVGETARKLADDMREGYRKIREQLAG